MSDDIKEEAAEVVKKAAKGAGRSGRAIRQAAPPVVEVIAEEAHEVAEEIEDLGVTIWSRLRSDRGQGVIAVGVMVGAGIFAAHRFGFIGKAARYPTSADRVEADIVHPAEAA